MRNLFVLLGLFTLLYHHSALASSEAYTIKLNDDTELVFLSYQPEFGYSQPRLKQQGKFYPIQGYDEMNYSGVNLGLDIKLSQNKRYLKMDNIIKGYVESPDQTSSQQPSLQLHENYQCVIVDLNAKTVVYSMSEYCDGDWQDNQWVSQGEVQFSE